MRYIGLLILISVSGIVNANNLSKFSKPSKLLTNNFLINLPVEIIHNRYILNNVKIKGSSKTYRFLLDTGASVSCLSEEIATEANLRVYLTDSISDLVEKKEVDYSFCDLSFSDIYFSKVGTVLLPADQINITGLCGKIDGIIGYNIIRKCIWQFNEDGVVLTDNIENLNNVGDIQQDKLTKGPLPYIVAGYKNGFRATMLFDLGDNGTLEVADKMIKYLREKEIRHGQGSLFTTLMRDSRDTATMKVVKVPGFFIGNDTIYNVITFVETGNRLHSTIGAGILNYFNMTFDFPKRRLYTRKLSDNFNDDNFNNYGFNYKVRNGKVYVRFVWNNSDAFNRGVECGQEILQINNLDFKNIKNRLDCELNEKIYEELYGNVSSGVVKIRIDGINGEIVLNRSSLFKAL